MLSEKKFYAQPKLYDYSGDLTKYWFVQYRNEQGKQVKLTKGINKHPTARARRKAAQIIIDEIREIQKARSYHRGRKKVFDYLELRKSSWAKKTYTGHKSKMHIFFEWLGTRPVDHHTIHLFFREYLMQRTGTTYNTYKIAMKPILREALDLDTDYIFKDLEKRKSNTQTPVYFSTNQIKFLSDKMKAQNGDLWLFVQFIYYCFMRPSAEVRFLKVGDVMLEDDRIVVHGGIAKNNKTRYCQIPQAFKLILEQELKNRDFREYIFYSTNTYKPVGVNTFRERHIKILRKNGFDTSRYKLYSWKNTGMVQAIKAGYPLK